MTKVTREVAQADVNRWLEAAKIDFDEPEDGQESEILKELKPLVNSVMKGRVMVSEDGVITQVLDFPVGEEKKITEITFKNRVTAGEIQRKMSAMKIDAKDTVGRLMVFVSVLTNVNYALVAKMDTKDYSTASYIASFLA